MPVLIALIPWIANAIGAGFSFLIKHPLVLKMMFFPFFISILLYVISFFANWLKPMISGSVFLSVAAYYGAIDAVAVYLSIITAGFAVRSVLRYVTT